MSIDINEDNLKHGLLGLVIAIVEIIGDALKHQALRRMEGGSLNDEEIERLGRALEEIDIAIDQLKGEQGITETVKNVRDGLDNLVDDVLDQMINPVKRPKRDFGSGEISRSGPSNRANPEKWAREESKKEIG